MGLYTKREVSNCEGNQDKSYTETRKKKSFDEIWEKNLKRAELVGNVKGENRCEGLLNVTVSNFEVGAW